MNSVTTLSIILFAMMCVVKTEVNNTRVHVGVYYESLCPYARKFFTKQLYPALQTNLSKFVELQLVPYGKATTTNHFTFICRHGEQECMGDIYQACVLKQLANNSPGLFYNSLAVEFINCLMDKYVTNTTYSITAQNCNKIVPIDHFDLLEKCVNNTDGTYQLAKLGELTNNLQNPLQAVPTIVFNRKYKKEETELAESHFVKALCQQIQGVKPKECTGSGDNLKFNYALVLSAMVLFKYLS